MGCYCECVYDDEPQTFFKESVHVARKKHQCCECHKDIFPGQKYESMVGIWDGKWYHDKTCLPCANIRDTLCGDCYTIGQLYENIAELSIADFERLSPAARDKISEVWG